MACAIALIAALVASPSAGRQDYADSRLGQLRTLDGHFPFTPSASKEAWQTRAEALRRQVRVALGLWPWPTKTPLNSVVHGAVSRDGYTVERVFFESMPGFFVTGSLYRPIGGGGRRPAVLSPHGHWPGGRFQDVGEADRRKELSSGAETYDNGARHILQARAVHLARMGAVVFLYDMIGYADSVQIPEAVAHSARGRRRASDEGLFFGVGAELGLNSILGLQIWSGVRALDFLAALPDVDPARIAVTGASGGGTQTFLLSAIDPRPAVAFPAVMVSTRMQGGCTCENADYLRIGTGNVELAALFAPKPLGMTAADDWTKTMPTDGFPQLQQHYALFDARDQVQLFPFLQFGHNYNAVSRGAMYGWLHKHLHLGLGDSTVERDFVPLTREEATVWTTDHPAPTAAGESAERAVIAWWQQDGDRQLAAARPVDSTTWQSWRDLIGGALQAMVARPLTATTIREPRRSRERAGGKSSTIDVSAFGERVAILTWEPSGSPKGTTVLTSSRGISALVIDGRPGLVVRQLLEHGQRVIGVDVIGQREPRARNRLVANRASAAYTYGYNAPLVVQRAHDVTTALLDARGAARPVSLIALDGPAAAWTVLVVGNASELVDKVGVVSGGFRFFTARTVEDGAFLPGAVKYGDLPALLTMAAPKPLWLAGESEPAVALLRDAYRAAGSPEGLTVSRASGDAAIQEAIAWVTRPTK